MLRAEADRGGRVDSSWLVILVLAVVQGITEFLPISSDGHLVILADLLEQDLEVGDIVIVLHVGTLFSILVYYWHRIWRLLGADRRIIPLLIIATIPAVIVGLPIKEFYSSLLEDPVLGAAMLIVTGCVLLAAARFSRGVGEYQQLTWRQAWILGMAQAAAILPGLSRSGLTISTGLGMGLAPRAAAVFSFLMAIPAIGGAAFLEAVSVWKKGSLVTPWEQLAAGVAVSFVVGLCSLWLLERVLVRGRFSIFAWWCIPAGLAYLAFRGLGLV
jgi:undecaprenyl-diphosphatase